MYVSEDSFVHLRHAADERMHRELEYRRIAQERATDSSPTPGAATRLVHRIRAWMHPAPRRLSHP
jgi:hypothetical protein